MSTSHHYPAGKLREDLVKKARARLESDGIEGVTIRDLAQRLKRGQKKGVTRAAIYYYFRSRTDLLTAIALGALAELQSQLEALLKIRGTARERLEGMMEAWWNFADDNPATYRLMNSELFAPPYDLKASMRVVYGMFMTTANEAGISGNKAIAIFTFMHGLAVVERAWLQAETAGKELEQPTRARIGRELLRTLL